VSCLTRGLLYGHEVKRPDWYKPERKKARARILHGRPALKREAIMRRMSNGWTLEQIARDLLISMHSLVESTRQIFKQERVKNRRELAAKLGWKHEQPLNHREKWLARAREREEKVLPLILEGLSVAGIGRRTGMRLGLITQVAGRIYQKHGLKKGEGRRALGKKFGVELKRFGERGSEMTVT